jgi:MerR family transcriptional regulator, mercuric resistance operon regulatory protein
MRANFDNLTIGALAAEADVHGETIRFYQRKGLLRQPQRQLGSVRRYGQADLGRLRFIKTAQKLGFSLEEIGQLLQLEDLAYIESALADVVERCEAVQGDICCPLIATLLDAGGAAK